MNWRLEFGIIPYMSAEQSFTLRDINQALIRAVEDKTGKSPEDPMAEPHLAKSRAIFYLFDLLETARERARKRLGDSWQEPNQRGRLRRKYGQQQVLAIIEELDTMTQQEAGGNTRRRQHLSELSVGSAVLRATKEILYPERLQKNPTNR